MKNKYKSYKYFTHETDRQSLTIPDSVESIGYNIFNEWVNLTRVSISASVRVIGAGAED
ncbi:MAG: leucine-rich repeat domain-containing protein [Spirochaetaceae bacterium]|jgi:hypothetical protein|nr:leucine-rich repeat domain-containing protein [Spirochaetaceae bacterium]